ncbi:MAG TPA: SURF1 family protein [Brachybacterium massiliense]|uniref:SURF1-like protein n=1 Tax=Brachybacterium massiliense TaxID=1755098 RepID=A0A921MTV5_9MICO|nr:SURF1 family protein [Brachybacterium massiliense]
MTGRSARREILLSRETLLGLVAVLVLAGVCVLLGLWQYGRYEDRRDEAAVVSTNYEAEPVALEAILPEEGQPLPAEHAWAPVSLHGSYCAEDDCVLYVRNRQLSGEVGFWQLVPFRTEDSTTLLVVRGWVPQAAGESAPADPAAVPTGELSVTVRMRPAEPVLDREPPPGQTHSVNPGQSAGLMGIEQTGLVAQAYGELVAEEPAAERPQALPSPDTSLGPHLSYAFQWWIFALFFPAALIYRTRQLFKEAAEDEEPAGRPAAEDQAADRTDTAAGPIPSRRTRDHRPRRAVRARRRGQDEEEEDALIDERSR